MSKKEFVQQMLQEMNGGALLDQLNHAIHEAAKSSVLHGDGKRTAEVTLKLTFKQIPKVASQTMVGNKLTFKQLTATGDRTENTSSEGAMHVTRTGVSITPDNQMDFVEQQRVQQEREEDRG